jgi:hypothetical protein
MSIIINEFEIVAPPAPREQPGGTQPGPAAQTQPAQTPRPEDVELVMQRLAQRRMRLWAD